MEAALRVVYAGRDLMDSQPLTMRYCIIISMPCDHCASALAKGDKFCGNCGSSTDSLTIELLNRQVVSLTAQVADLLTEQRGTEQRFLEVETAERIVARLMSWAKLFSFFIGIPAALILIGLGIWAGKSIKGFHDIASTAQTSVSRELDKARTDARVAEVQAINAMHTADGVNHNIQVTRKRLDALGAKVEQSTYRVRQLDTGVSQQQRKLSTLAATTAAQSQAVDKLTAKVQTLNTSHIVQEIEMSHPEFGTHVVYGPAGETLTKDNKPLNKLYVQIEVFNENTYKPHFTPATIASGISKLQDHDFAPLVGQVALFASTGRTSTPLGSLGINSCRAAGLRGPTQLGVPCIIYFRDDMRAKALEARDLLSGVEKVPDDRIKLVPLSQLLPAQKELVDKSGLDISVVLGP